MFLEQSEVSESLKARLVILGYMLAQKSLKSQELCLSFLFWLFLSSSGNGQDLVLALCSRVMLGSAWITRSRAGPTETGSVECKASTFSAVLNLQRQFTYLWGGTKTIVMKTKLYTFIWIKQEWGLLNL